jgi:hypothetical protein
MRPEVTVRVTVIGIPVALMDAVISTFMTCTTDQSQSPTPDPPRRGQHSTVPGTWAAQQLHPSTTCGRSSAECSA